MAVVEGVVTGIVANFLYEKCKERFPNSVRPFVPGFLQGASPHIKEADRLLAESVAELRSEYKSSKTVQIFLGHDSVTGRAALKSVLAYLLAGGDDPHPRIMELLNSCRVGGEYTRGNNPGGVTLPRVARGIIRTIERHFSSSERLVGFLTYSSLGRLRTQLKVADSIAKQLRSISAHQDQRPSDEFKDFCFNYVTALKKQVRKVRLHGVEKVTSKGGLSQELNSTFIDVEFESSAPKSSRTQRIEGEFAARHQSTEVLRVVPKCILKGSAGSGKTTVLQKFILDFDEGSFREERDGSLQLIPFYIPLRRLEIGYTQSWDLVSAMSQVMPNPMLERAFNSGIVSQLRSEQNRAIFLLDGLDELSEANRTKFWDLVEDIESELPSAKIVITTRTLSGVHYADGSLKDSIFRDRAAYTRSRTQWRPSDEFFEFTVCSLSNTQVSNLIDRWFDGVDKEVREYAGTLKSWDSYPQELKRVLFTAKQHEVLDLARTPLLCSLICLVFYLRDGALPVSRRQLYEIASRLLLEVRDASRDVRISESLKDFDLARRESLIQSIALEMQEGHNIKDSQSIEISRTSAEVIVKRWLDVNNFSSVTAPEVLDFIMERCAVIRQPSAELVDFVHRSFMEYFAANEIVLKRGPHSVRAKIADEQWQATLRFAMDTPQGGVYFGGNLIREIVEYIVSNFPRRKDREARRALAYRVASLLDHTQDYPHNCDEALRKLCEMLLPPESRSEAFDCKEVPIKFLDGFLNYAEVAKQGAASIRASAFLLTEHGDPRCAEFLNSGFQECGEIDVIEAINASGRVRFSEHTALLKRISNGSFKGRVYMDADEIQSAEMRKLIMGTVGIRFPFTGRHFVGWDILRRVYSVVLINPVRRDWDAMLSSRSQKFRSCSFLEIQGGADFSFSDIAELFPNVKEVFLEDCRHFSAVGVNRVSRLEILEFRRMSYQIQMNLGQVPSALQLVNFAGCPEVDLSGEEEARASRNLEVTFEVV